MSNPSRGEATLVLGDTRIPIRFGLSAIRSFEQATGKGVVGAFGEMSRFQFGDVCTAIVIGARQMDPKTRINLQRLDRLIDENPEDAGKAFQDTIAALLEALPKMETDEEDESEGAGGASVPL